MKVAVKICGLKDKVNLGAAMDNGAAFAGFVFFSKSPRALTPEEAQPLIQFAGQNIKKVGLVVDASDQELEHIMRCCRLDMLQLHGQESPTRIKAVQKKFGVPIMKAVPMARTADLLQVKEYEQIVDWLLLDAKPLPDDTRPGGNARTFDWSIVSGMTALKPWMLAGGLHLGNIQEAVQISGAKYIDISSGVEEAGAKSPKKIKDLLLRAHRIH